VLLGRLHYTLKLGALTYFIRQDPGAPAEQVFEKEEVQILGALSKKDIRTLRQAVLALGKIVGFATSKKQPFPGVKVLASALERLFFINIGAKVRQNNPLQD
jgi:hypothetical protein